MNESSQNLHLNFKNLDLNKCNRLRIFDASSGRTINSYDMSRAGNDPSYTLSRVQIGALVSDCNLGFTVSGYGSYPETRYVRIGWCAPVYTYPTYPTYPSYDYVTYEWSQTGHCKKMVNGQYSGYNVPDYQAERYCGARPYQSRPSQREYYEWSNTHKCKRMVNGQFMGHVPDYYCR
ncbi:MAG: hypothetical protein K2X47_14205 [Bdellovibrionales bacterium]|nr:hypothetical protein [Bdellovibrionales bacterium]